MPAPASQPTWATDTNYTNGPDVGTATKVAPSGAIQAEGHVPATKAAPQRMNWWMNLVGQWTTWLEAERARLAGYIGGADGSGEWAYPAVRSRTIQLSPIGRIHSGTAKIVGGASAGVLTQDVPLDDGWRPAEANLYGGGPGGTDTYAPGHYVSTALPQHLGYMDLSDVLRSGMTITGVTVRVDPGSAQATASDRMKWELVKRDLTGFGAPVSIATGVGANSAAQAAITTTGLTEVVNRATHGYWLYVWSSAGADSNADAIYGVSLTVNDPGPRSY